MQETVQFNPMNRYKIMCFFVIREKHRRIQNPEQNQYSDYTLWNSELKPVQLHLPAFFHTQKAVFKSMGFKAWDQKSQHSQQNKIVVPLKFVYILHEPHKRLDGSYNVKFLIQVKKHPVCWASSCYKNETVNTASQNGVQMYRSIASSVI